MNVGAAIRASQLNGQDHATRAITVSDVASHAMGIDLVDDAYEIIIAANSKIPSSFTKTVTTSIDYQTVVNMNIYEGEFFSYQKINIIILKSKQTKK